VVGGSLGAKALNDIVPKALACIRPASGRRSSTRAAPSRSTNCAPTTRPPASGRAHALHRRHGQAFADADLVICRAGASTVTEIAAVGAAAVFVPFPFAVDDHQTTNARFLVDAGGGWLIQQRELTPDTLATAAATRPRDDAAAARGGGQEHAKDPGDRADGRRLRGPRKMKHAIKHIHFVGIGGAGMSGIAEVLRNLGYLISGSDLPTAPRCAACGLGIQTFVGHAAANVIGADAVVTSTAVQAGQPRGAGRAQAQDPVVPRA
jgi:hypothetical protein